MLIQSELPLRCLQKEFCRITPKASAFKRGNRQKRRTFFKCTCTVHFRPRTKVSLFTKVWVAKRHAMTINLCGKSANSFQDVLGLFSMYGRFFVALHKVGDQAIFWLRKKARKKSIVAATILAWSTRDFMKSESFLKELFNNTHTVVRGLERPNVSKYVRTVSNSFSMLLG